MTAESGPGADWEAIRDRLVTRVGTVVSRSLGAQTALQFRRFAVASTRADQGTESQDDASPAVAPPLYLSAVLGWGAGPLESGLRADGSEPADMAGLDVEGLRLMGAGQSLEFLRPVVSGTAVTMETSVDDIELKSGRSGSFVVISLLRTYLDENGAELLRCHEKFIAR